MVFLGREKSLNDLILHPSIEAESVLKNLFHVLLVVGEELRLKSLSIACFDESVNLGFHGLLREPKVLIHRVLEHLSVEEDLSVIDGIQLDSMHNRCRPFDNQLLQPISLVQKREHELLHSFPRLLIHKALVVVLLLRMDDLKDQVLRLLLRVKLHLRERVDIYSAAAIG